MCTLLSLAFLIEYVSKIRKIGLKNKIKLSDGLRLIIEDYNKNIIFCKKNLI